MPSEQRRFLRWNRNRSGLIRYDGASGPEIVACIVSDISAGGAKLLVADASGVPSNIQFSLDGTTYQDCLVRWIAPGALGVEFVAAWLVSFWQAAPEAVKQATVPANEA